MKTFRFTAFLLYRYSLKRRFFFGSKKPSIIAYCETLLCLLLIIAFPIFLILDALHINISDKPDLQNPMPGVLLKFLYPIIAASFLSLIIKKRELDNMIEEPPYNERQIKKGNTILMICYITVTLVIIIMAFNNLG
jgi:hypothetical protein